MGPDEFPPHPGRLSDFFPEAQPDHDARDDIRTQADFDTEFEHLFMPQVAEAAMPQELLLPPPPDLPPAASPDLPSTTLRDLPRAAPRVDRRRRRRRFVRLRRNVSLGVAIATFTGAVASTISVLGAMVSYGPLRLLAAPTAQGLAGLWPLLVYGPWLAGCLTVLHAAAHRRPARTGWIAVVLFSVIAMALCIAHAPRTITASATAGLPPFSALASFILLSRQITLIRPSQPKPKVPRQRRRKH